MQTLAESSHRRQDNEAAGIRHHSDTLGTPTPFTHNLIKHTPNTHTNSQTILIKIQETKSPIIIRIIYNLKAPPQAAGLQLKYRFLRREGPQHLML